MAPPKEKKLCYVILSARRWISLEISFIVTFRLKLYFFFKPRLVSFYHLRNNADNDFSFYAALADFAERIWSHRQQPHRPTLPFIRIKFEMQESLVWFVWMRDVLTDDDINKNFSVLLQTLIHLHVFGIRGAQLYMRVHFCLFLPAVDPWKVIAHHHRISSDSLRHLHHDCYVHVSDRMEQWTDCSSLRRHFAVLSRRVYFGLLILCFHRCHTRFNALRNSKLNRWKSELEPADPETNRRRKWTFGVCAINCSLTFINLLRNLDVITVLLSVHLILTTFLISCII